MMKLAYYVDIQGYYQRSQEVPWDGVRGSFRGCCCTNVCDRSSWDIELGFEFEPLSLLGLAANPTIYFPGVSIWISARYGYQRVNVWGCERVNKTGRVIYLPDHETI